MTKEELALAIEAERTAVANIASKYGDVVVNTRTSVFGSPNGSYSVSLRTWEDAKSAKRDLKAAGWVASKIRWYDTRGWCGMGSGTLCAGFSVYKSAQDDAREEV